jgi:hypothetical protein
VFHGPVGSLVLRFRTSFFLWLKRFRFRLETEILQSGHEFILKKPEDPPLYESVLDSAALAGAGSLDFGVADSDLLTFC